MTILGNLVSAALISIFAALLWPSRKQILAAMRSWIRVKDVNLYLSERRDEWNIEVPFRYVNDVKWRLREFKLRPTSLTSSGSSDEYSETFRFRIATYDQSYDDDVIDILKMFKRARITMASWSEWGNNSRAAEAIAEGD
ncbi:MAG: hypothetical protein JWQ12_1754 [Glaciihabitans sp.]|nr:hypothetical protein [Glaciihabitans sp.]